MSLPAKNAKDAKKNFALFRVFRGQNKRMKHYKEKLSAFANHELAYDERHKVAEHLLQCADCRREHDQIKFGVALAQNLKRAAPPENLWNKIEAALDEKEKISRLPNFTFFNRRDLLAAAGLIFVCGLAAAIYFNLSKNAQPETAQNQTTVESANSETPPKIANEVSSNQTANAQTAANSEAKISPATNANVQTQPSNAKTQSAPKKISPAKESNKTAPAPKNLPAWNVETLAGMPRAGGQTIAQNGKLAVGEFLETDANSRARVEVANIGEVEIAPNSRVRLVNTSADEHRLALKKGILQAKIFAPPRLFIVDTPSAVAVDLGCEYTLEVDDEGSARLHVTSGFVALENGKYESIVPAGAIALTKKGKGVGTPFAEDASAALRAALYKFDFEAGGAAALETVIKEANLYDSLTLWHLLPRVPTGEREKVFAALAALVKPPTEVTKQGILRLDKKMLELWWTEIENVWFG
jgi:cytoskeletal protein RodZ